MGVGWIDSIYNTTGRTWYLRSVDSGHNGSVTPDGMASFTLDDGCFHPLAPNKHFHADWCGIPWYYQDIHYKAFSVNQAQYVRFFTSYVDGANWLYYEDGVSGATLARQKAPNVDFHCTLRFTDGGPALEVTNDDGSTQAVMAFIANGLNQWTGIGAGGLGSLLKNKSGAGTSIPAPASPPPAEQAPAPSPHA